ncbi:MAG: sigma-70 family RNA polymerase sigma factor, partial [Clostridia bacterium]|nr:sigma-70 family RNA polymerase sigma factor [Clostridia bacterium]
MSQINQIVTKAKNGDVESMEYILTLFKPKVTAICREYFLLGADFDDLLQEGMIGVYKAVGGYNSGKSDNFSQFVTMCIHHQVQNAVRVANSKKNQPLN